MPLTVALMNYFIPLHIGARDVAFPRLNAFSFWCFFFGGLFINSSWFLGGGADGGWFNYAPNNGVVFSPTHGIDFWNTGLILTGISSLVGAVNLITTVLNMRAPGMTLMRMPVFTWMSFVTQFLLLFAIPVLTSAQFLLLFDRLFGARFFDVSQGADPLLWEHLFWIFGHPEVYVMFLPGAAIISHILPIHARTRLVGYPFVVMAIIVTAIMSLGLWVHHMYTVGLPPITLSFFTAASMAITLASGVQVFAWIATLWVGRPRFTVPMLFSLGFIFTFVAGGITGVMVASAPFDAQVHDSYFVVAHFHYVIIGGLLFPVFAALVHWWPKFTGRMVSTVGGHVSFWLIFLGFHVTFFPMHLLGFWGMPRRVYTYPPGLGLDTANLISTIGSFVLAAGVLLLTLALGWAAFRGRPAPANSWGGDSLEWLTASPPNGQNHDAIPVVASRAPLWEPPEGELDPEQRRAIQAFDHAPLHVRSTITTTIVEARPEGAIRLSEPTYWPFVAALGLLGAIVGALVEIYAISVVALLVVVAGLLAWAWRNEVEMSPEDTAPVGGVLPIEAPGPRSMGWWGALSGAVVLLIAVSTLGFSSLYLQVHNPLWAPNGTLGQPVVTIATGVLVGVAALATWWGSRQGEDHVSRAGGPRTPHLTAAAVALAAAVLALGLTWLKWSRAGLDHTAHAYDSAAMTMLGAQALGIVMATAITVAALMARVRHERDIRPRLMLANSAVLWTGALVAWVIVWVVTDLLPVVLI